MEIAKPNLNPSVFCMHVQAAEEPEATASTMSPLALRKQGRGCGRKTCLKAICVSWAGATR